MLNCNQFANIHPVHPKFTEEKERRSGAESPCFTGQASFLLGGAVQWCHDR